MLVVKKKKKKTKKKVKKSSYLAPSRRQGQERVRARHYDPEPSGERRGDGQREGDLPCLAEGPFRVRCGGRGLYEFFFFFFFFFFKKIEGRGTKMSLLRKSSQSPLFLFFGPLFPPCPPPSFNLKIRTWKESEFFCAPGPTPSSKGNSSLARNASPIASLAAESAAASPFGSTLVASNSPTSLRSSVGPRKSSRQSSREREVGVGASGVAAGGGGGDGEGIGSAPSDAAADAADAADALPPPPPRGFAPPERKPFCMAIESKRADQ